MPSAHQNGFDEVKLLAKHADHENIDGDKFIFYDEHYNQIVLEPKMRHVEAGFYVDGISEHRLGYLPIDYRTYKIEVNKATMIDLENIEQWKLAKDILIENAHYPSYETLKRVLKLQRTRNLKCFVRD